MDLERKISIIPKKCFLVSCVLVNGSSILNEGKSFFPFFCEELKCRRMDQSLTKSQKSATLVIKYLALEFGRNTTDTHIIRNIKYIFILNYSNLHY